MKMFDRTISYVCVLFLSIVYRLTNAQESETPMATVSPYKMTDSTSTSSLLPVPNSIVDSSITSVLDESTPTISTSTSANSNTSIVQVNTSTVDNVRLPDTPSGPGWWLLVALLITIVFVLIGGVTFYYRKQSPYRRSTSCLQWCRQCRFRFLRNWRSRDDDADNIILQLEQPEVNNGQWPPRISFT